jgi:hypothetical protein
MSWQFLLHGELIALRREHIYIHRCIFELNLMVLPVLTAFCHFNRKKFRNFLFFLQQKCNSSKHGAVFTSQNYFVKHQNDQLTNMHSFVEL